MAQSTCFGKELIYLKKDEGVHQSSKLLQLSPFIDHNGLIRVGGRIQKSHAPDNMKNPIILPHNPRITQLIIDDCHQNHLHSGFSLTFTSLKRNYWVLRGRDTVRNFIRKCVKCRRAKATVKTQLMGNLPTGRVTANRPFLHSGVDFAGPFQVKIKKGDSSPLTRFTSVFLSACQQKQCIWSLFRVFPATISSRATSVSVPEEVSLLNSTVTVEQTLWGQTQFYSNFSKINSNESKNY